MRRPCAAVLLLLHLPVMAQNSAPPVVAPDWAQQSAPKTGVVDPHVVEEAVRATLADAAKETPPSRPDGDVLRGERYERFGREFEEARVPGCLRPDGLKRQATGIGPFQLGGLLAAPFVLVAKLRGKCN
ncbi:MAG: hypothetical protein ACLGI6_14815 [Gammaproteobacteria bacterium]